MLMKKFRGLVSQIWTFPQLVETEVSYIVRLFVQTGFACGEAEKPASNPGFTHIVRAVSCLLLFANFFPPIPAQWRAELSQS